MSLEDVRPFCFSKRTLLELSTILRKNPPLHPLPLCISSSPFVVQLNSRWTKFLSVTVPFATRVVKDYTSGSIMKNERELARDLRIVIEKLGPTFIKVAGLFCALLRLRGREIFAITRFISRVSENITFCRGDSEHRARYRIVRSSVA